MRRNKAPVPLCILRVDAERERLMITVTISYDIAASANPLVRRFIDAEQAVAAVAEFLESARKQSPPGRI
jgi:hypothetical protein